MYAHDSWYTKTTKPKKKRGYTRERENTEASAYVPTYYIPYLAAFTNYCIHTQTQVVSRWPAFLRESRRFAVPFL